VIKMREPDGTQLPLVESFGEELQRAIANRAGSRRRSRRRALSLAFAAGLVAVSLMTSPGRAATGLVGEWLGLAEPGDPPTVKGPRQRGGLQQEPTGSVVLAAGRAPDGARYEFVLEHVAEPAKSKLPAGYFGHCLNIEWPDARTGPISPQFGCYPTFPPAAIDRAVVKRQGAMFDPTYTSHVQIAGLARADVSDVRILYKDQHGVMSDARVDFARVTGAVRERAGADGAFGVFIAFLPPAWLGYGGNYDPRTCPPKQLPYDAEAIEVIAYDNKGEALARETGNNILSVGGRPPCR
jgi:hypothetical protein